MKVFLAQYPGEGHFLVLADGPKHARARFLDEHENRGVHLDPAHVNIEELVFSKFGVRRFG
ncbi:hypothetical protein LCGC14_2185530 [marine sediment metagenome]|uniref:Uncharacterized protein n=1 Tax=marine sediment metagenome TaxID=412755 RepID=A0A0F9GGW3_9ZZZZ